MDHHVQFDTVTFLNDEGVLQAQPEVNIPDETLVRIFQIMLLTRLVDDRMITLQRQGSISFAMSSLGEEACSVASAAALQFEDWLYPQYREAGIIFWRGFTIEQYVNHMFGNANDLILGRQMPNHFGSRQLNIVQVSSPIGTKIPHAAGCAYAMKIQKESTVSVCYFGEGATSEGDFHAGLNFAAVKKVPALFFCRNNGYAISTPCSRQFASDGVAPKGIAYGIPSYRIDGNDVFAVYSTVARARQACIEGKGPILIEAMTYRMGAHSTSDDPSCYRKEEEVVHWEKKCPVNRLRKHLISKMLWSDSNEKAYVEEIQKQLNQAIEEARKAPHPPLHSLIENVYFEVPPSLENEYQELVDSLNETNKETL